jgi:hypothetical protein
MDSSIITRLKKDAERQVAEIIRLLNDRNAMRRLLQTDPDVYNEISIHGWHSTLASERAVRYTPMPGERLVCPRCYVLSGQTRALIEMTTPITLVECAYCGYKLIPNQAPQGALQADPEQSCETQINPQVNRDK